MYLVAIAWLYVTGMMALAEATNPTGSVLGALITFVLYGLLPLSLVLYILGTPERKRRLRAQRAAEQAQWEQAQQLQSTPSASATAAAKSSSASPSLHPPTPPS